MLLSRNADDLWVFESTRRFAPNVQPIMSQIPILSARRKHEANFPGDVFAWKRETFREAPHGVIRCPKGFALCSQLILVAQGKSERIELEILRISFRRCAEILILEPDSASQDSV